MSFLQMSASGGIMILAIVLIRALTIDRLPKKTFLILWGVVLLRLLVPVSLPSPYSVYSFLQQHTSISDTPVETVLPLTSSYSVAIETPSVTEPIVAEPSNHIPTATNPSAAPYAPTVQPSADAPVEGYGWSVTELLREIHISPLSLLWTVGTLICAVFFLIAYFRCYREFQMSLPIQNQYVKDWLNRHTLRRSIQIRQSDRIFSPLTYGVFRPVILLPKNTNWRDTEHLDYVLTHEWTHICYFDAIKKFFLTAALCFHWFNPLVWVMYILANRDIELFCDETVIRCFAGEDIRADYAMTLLSMEETKRSLAPLCNHFSKNALEERVRSIMKTRKVTIAVAVTALLLVVVFTAIFATSAQPKLSGLISKNANLIITRTDLTNETDEITFSEYEFQAGSEEILQIRRILEKYTYSPSFDTLFGSSDLGGTDTGYFLNLYSSGQNGQSNGFLCGGNGKLIVNGKTYRMDCSDNQNSSAMMEEISAVLLNSQDFSVEAASYQQNVFMASKDAVLTNCFTIEDGEIYTLKNQTIRANDVLLVYDYYDREGDGLCLVQIPYGTIPYTYGYLPANAISEESPTVETVNGETTEIKSRRLLHVPSIEGEAYTTLAMLSKDTTLTDCFTMNYETSEPQRSGSFEHKMKRGDVVQLCTNYSIDSKVVLVQVPYGEVPYIYGYVAISALSRLAPSVSNANQVFLDETISYDGPNGKKLGTVSQCYVEILQNSGDWYQVRPVDGGEEAYWVTKFSFNMDCTDTDFPYDRELIQEQIDALQSFLDQTVPDDDYGQVEWEAAFEEKMDLELMLGDLEFQKEIDDTYGAYGLEYCLPENRLYAYHQPVSLLTIQQGEKRECLWNDNDGEVVVLAELNSKGEVESIALSDSNAVGYVFSPTRTYAVEPDDAISPSIGLNEKEHTFHFSYDPFASNLHAGAYHIKDGVLTAVTISVESDESEVFKFRVIDEDTLSFIQDGSSPIEILDKTQTSPIVDGTIFHLCG